MDEQVKTQKSPTRILTGLIVVVLVLVLAVGAVSGINLYMLTQQAQVAEDENATKEDDVTIAGSYKIRSTTQISDAYKSGDTSGLSDRDKETLDMASAVLSEIITEDMSDYEKEKACYDWMTHKLGQDRGLLTVIPSSGADSDNPYGVLKYQNAVCVGYATTFRLFMQMMDIPCMVVHNTEAYHSWDLVQLDGDWYHVDCYSGTNSNNYRYFNMTDNMNAQSWDREFFPAALSLKYNVAYQESEPCDDIYQIPAYIRTALDEKQDLISLLFPTTLTEPEAQLANNMASEVEQVLWTVPDYSETYMERNWYPLGQDGNLYVITINRYIQDEDETSDEITDEQREQATQAVQDAFSDISDAEISVDGENDEIMYDEAYEVEYDDSIGSGSAVVPAN